MSAFLQEFIRNREKVFNVKKEREEVKKEDVISSHKDVIREKPCKSVVYEYFKQKVELLNAPDDSP